MATQSDPWTLLGIEYNASEREVKSAYARLLKITRPDEDAGAFQQLVEARVLALAYARLLQAPVDDSPSQTTQFDLALPDDTPDTERLEQVIASETIVVPEPITPSDSIDPAETEIDVDAIVAGLGPNADHGQFSDAAGAINALSGASIAVRRNAELPLLHAIEPLLPVISNQILGGRISGSDWLNSMRKDEAALHRLSVQFDLIQMLNDDFGWTSSDRPVYMLLGGDAGAKLIGYLNTMQRTSFAKKESEEHRWRLIDAPTINEVDALSYFGSSYSGYAPLLAKMRSDSRLLARQRNTPFLLPLWVWLDLYHILLMSLLPYLILFWPTVSIYLERTFFLSGWAWIASIGVVLLVALPFCVPAFSKKSEIRYFLSKVAQADRQMRYDPAKRADFLRATHRAGWWWVAFVFMNLCAWGSLLLVIERLFLPFTHR